MEDNKNPFKEEEQSEEIKETSDEIQEENKEMVDEEPKEEIKEEQSEETNEFQIKYEDLNNKYLRLAADFDNFRKRTMAEKEELSKFACAELLKKILPSLDTFDRAQEHLKEIEDCKVVKESYEVAYKQLIEALKKIGMEEIVCLGEKFNPNEHEAITQIPTEEYEPDCVAVVAQKGYKMADRVIRPALVGVAVEKAE